MKNKLFLFLITLGISFTCISCLPSYTSKIPYFWKEKGTSLAYASALVHPLKGNDYQFEYGMLIPVSSSGHSAYILEEVEIIKKVTEKEYSITILPIKKLVGKEGSAFRNKEKVYFFDKEEKIRIPDTIKRIRFIYENKEHVLELPLVDYAEIVTLTN